MIGVNDFGIIPNPGSGMNRRSGGFDFDSGVPVGATIISGEKTYSKREIQILDMCWAQSAFNPANW